MVVYVDNAEHASFVAERRLGMPTRIITLPLRKIKFYKLRHMVEHIQQSSTWRNNTKYLGRLENQLPMYIVIIFNKFAFMEEVARVNPFNSNYFWWLDAGLSRFWEPEIALKQSPWPNMTRVQQLDPKGDRVFLKKDVDDETHYNVPVTTREEVYNFLCGGGNGFLATMFGGTKVALEWLLADVEDFLFSEMLPMEAVGNEQMYMYILYSRNKDRIAAIPSSAGWLGYLT